MPTLIDTSVLARLLERDSARGRAAERTLSEPDGDWAVCSQVLTEFWVVATRPAVNNGYGLDPGEVDASIEDLLAAFIFLPDPPELFEIWRELVVTHKIRGKPAHDARLIALIRAHGANRILTFNPRDFQRYSDIELVTPTVDTDD